jgi:4-amino-4-deoxy-L-arabinose transferase-like glycosyltransferase
MKFAGAWPLAAILLLSASLNLWQIGFPLGYHIDEPVKVDFIKQGTQNFNHPILMLQLVRMTNLAFGFTNDQHIVVLGRSIVTLCAMVTVFLSYLLARRVVRHRGALIVAAGVAGSPTLVIHAHYLKEDTLLTLWLMASLLAFLKFTELATWRTAMWLGLAAGLAFSSHYKAILLVPLFVTAPMFGALTGQASAIRRSRLAQFYGYLMFAGLLATVVFLLVNWPLVHDVEGFLTGAGTEARHSIDGEDARIRPTDFWLGFHLFYSLAPGMSWPALAVGLTGLLWILLRWHREGFQDRLLAGYVLLFYLVPEISPLKPAPDFARYMVPIVPALIYVGWRSVEEAGRTMGSLSSSLLATAATIALVVVPLYCTVRLTSSISHDTRAQAAEWLQQQGGKALIEYYAGLRSNTWSAAEVDVPKARDEGVAYVVTSSFMYGRYFLGSQLRNQDDEIYRNHQRYVDLFKHPYVEISPAYRTFGFNNPVIRIVDIRVPKRSVPSEAD